MKKLLNTIFDAIQAASIYKTTNSIEEVRKIIFKEE